MDWVIAPRRGGHLHWIYPELKRVLQVDRPDLVHVISEPWGARAVQAAAWCARQAGSRLIVHGCDRQWFHGSGVEQVGKEWLTRFVIQRSSAYVAETLDAAQQVRRFDWGEHVSIGAIHTSPKDDTTFKPPSGRDEKLAARRELGLPTSGTGVLFLGRLAPEKGPLAFLECASVVGARHREAWFAIAGQGPMEVGIRRRAGRAGVHFIGHLGYPVGVLRALHAADVVVVPSVTTAMSSEQGPRVVIEAMLTGCLVVGSTCGAIPEMIQEHGITFNESDLGAMTGAVQQAIRRMRRNSNTQSIREHALARYSTAAASQQLSTLWKDVLSDSPRATAERRSYGGNLV